MAKIDFNVPFILASGEPSLKPVLDKTKPRINPANGSISYPGKKDSDGNDLLEPTMMKDTLSQVLNAHYEGDNSVEFNTRVSRGKLAKKVADTTKGSLKNYTTDELTTIKQIAAKGGTTEFLVALELLIEGEETASDVGEDA